MNDCVRYRSGNSFGTVGGVPSKRRDPVVPEIDVALVAVGTALLLFGRLVISGELPGLLLSGIFVTGVLATVRYLLRG